MIKHFSPAVLPVTMGLTGLVLAGVVSCSGPKWEAGPDGDWFAGDFHVHSAVGSNDTRRADGTTESWPENIAAVAKERGMSFVVVTDHSNSAGSITDSTVEDFNLFNQGPEFPLWQTAAALSDDGFLFINGSEVSPVSWLAEDTCPNCPERGEAPAAVGHVGCVPLDLETFDTGGAFIDRPPGQVTGGETVEQCKERNGFAIVNHPYPEVAPWLLYDWTSMDYDALEVWNGSHGFNMYDVDALEAYLCDRLQGRSVVAVGGSDNHRTLVPYEGAVNFDPPVGLPMTSVFAPSLEWSAIMRAATEGRMVLHDKDTFVEFRIYAGNRYVGTIGDTISAASDDATFLVRGRSPVAQDLQLYAVEADSCIDPREPGTTKVPVVVKEVVWRAPVCDDGAPCVFEERVELSLKPGLYYAAVGDIETRTLNVRNVAFTNVVTIK
jgi:hypothetical protein